MTATRILIVNANWFGDVLLSTPAIRAVKKQFPGCYLGCLVPPRCEAVLKHNPYLDEVIVCPDRFAPRAYGRVIQRLRLHHFDTALFFKPSRTKALLCALAGIGNRISETPDPRKHRTDHFLSLVGKIGVRPDGREPDFTPSSGSAETWEAFRRRLGLDGRYAVVHAGGNWPLKRWPPERFTGWVRGFLKEYPGRVVLIGSESEKGLLEEVRSGEPRIVSAYGQTDLDTLAWLLKGADLLVSNDSGPIHLAASQRTPIIGVFGPTDPALTGPVSAGPVRIVRKDVGCEIPCYFKTCDTRYCMEWITPEEVLEKTKELMTNVKTQMTNE